MVLRYAYALFWAMLAISLGQEELLKNPDFESDFDGNWYCNGCILERSTDSYTGTYAGSINTRQAYWAGLAQDVPLKSNTKYYFTAMIKYKNDAGELFEEMNVRLRIDYADGTTSNFAFSWLPHMRKNLGYQSVGGDFATGVQEIISARLFFQVSEPSIEYLVDTASLTEIIPNANWKDEANARIESLRKADITFNVNISSAYQPSEIQIEATLKQHAFPFGTAVKADYISGTDDVSRKYQQFFYDNFEMAVLENSLKWKQMEKIQNDINYDRPLAAINELEKKGIAVRGHCVFWEIDNHLPAWLTEMTAEEVQAQIPRRAQYVVSAFKGRLIHWDVNNEELHGSFFKDQTQNADIIETMFNLTNQHDPNVKLFLNEYDIIKTSVGAHAYMNQAIRVKASGAPIYGIGIQSHVNDDNGRIDPDIIQRRLDVISQAGLPLWISELDYPNLDENEKADGYEMLLRVYYSNQNIEGVLLWGFWDLAHSKPDAALVNGEDWVINAAGLRWQKLLRQEWNTTATLQPSQNVESLQLRGFQGNYSVNVRHQGNIIKTLTFDIANLEKTQTISIHV